MENSRNIKWHHSTVTREQREIQNGHKGLTIWFTGLSASGKSTVANCLEEKLFKMGCHAMVLDGDNIRYGLNKNLGFSKEDREENIRRIGELSKLLTSKAIINIAAFISPYRADRAAARALQDEGDFIEVFIKCPIDVCEMRDPKGLYQKARAGIIKDFTGISQPYEEPEKPELVIDTSQNDAERCADDIISYLRNSGILLMKDALEATL
jgi:adenylylsulfate kinase